MNSIQSILVVCLLAFAACDARILSRRELEERQLLPPPCGKCNPLSDLELQGLTEALKDLGPALQAATTLLGDALNKVFANLQDLKLALQKAIQSIKDTIGPVFDKLYEAVKNIESCPALKDLFMNLKTNLMAFLDVLDKEWIPLINAPDLTTTLAALSKALLKALPDIVKLLRDLIYNVLQITGLCQLLGTLFWGLLAPNETGEVYKLLKTLLETSGGDGAKNLLTGLLGGLGGLLDPLLGAVGGKGGLDGILKLICELLKGLGLGGQHICFFG